MKATLLALALLGLTALPAAALALDVDDIIELSKAGVSADVILHRIDASDDVFHLSNEDIIRLKDAGVNDRVIMRMIDTEDDRSRSVDEDDDADREEDLEDEDDDRYRRYGRYDRDVDWDVHLGFGYYRGYGPRWYDYSWYPYAGYLYDYCPPYYYSYRPHYYYRGWYPGRYRHTYTKRYADPGRTSWGRGSTRVKGHSAGRVRAPGAGYRAPAESWDGSGRSVVRKGAPGAYAPAPAGGVHSGPVGGGSRTVVRK